MVELEDAVRSGVKALAGHYRSRHDSLVHAEMQRRGLVERDTAKILPDIASPLSSEAILTFHVL